MTETLAQRAERTTIAMEKAGYPAVAACLRALVAANAQLERERDEALAEWPEWARTILAMLQEYGWQYDAEEHIDIAAEVRSWGEDTDAACRAEIERARKQRDAANAARVAAEGTLRAAKALMDDINEFGGCSDGRIFDAAWTQVTAALTPAPEAPTDGE